MFFKTGMPNTGHPCVPPASLWDLDSVPPKAREGVKSLVVGTADECLEVAIALHGQDTL